MNPYPYSSVQDTFFLANLIDISGCCFFIEDNIFFHIIYYNCCNLFDLHRIMEQVDYDALPDDSSRNSGRAAVTAAVVISVLIVVAVVVVVVYFVTQSSKHSKPPPSSGSPSSSPNNPDAPPTTPPDAPYPPNVFPIPPIASNKFGFKCNAAFQCEECTTSDPANCKHAGASDCAVVCGKSCKTSADCAGTGTALNATPKCVQGLCRPFDDDGNFKCPPGQTASCGQCITPETKKASSTPLLKIECVGGNGSLPSKWPPSLPRYWNWAELGFTSPIKSQCGGTCVKNSQIGRTESMWFLTNGTNARPQPIQDLLQSAKEQLMNANAKQTWSKVIETYAPKYLQTMKTVYPDLTHLWDQRFQAAHSAVENAPVDAASQLDGMLPTFSFGPYSYCRANPDKGADYTVHCGFSKFGVYLDYDRRSQPSEWLPHSGATTDQPISPNLYWPWEGSCALCEVGAGCRGGSQEDFEKCITSKVQAKEFPISKQCNSNCQRDIRNSCNDASGCDYCAGRKSNITEHHDPLGYDFCSRYHRPYQYASCACQYMSGRDVYTGSVIDGAKPASKPFITPEQFVGWTDSLPTQPSTQTKGSGHDIDIQCFAHLLYAYGPRGVNVWGVDVNSDKEKPKSVCQKKDNHQIVCVGYDASSEDSSDWYWIVRNSWGDARPGAGFVRITMTPCKSGSGWPAGLRPQGGSI